MTVVLDVVEGVNTNGGGAKGGSVRRAQEIDDAEGDDELRRDTAVEEVDAA